MRRKKLKKLIILVLEAVKLRIIVALTNNNDILTACVKRIEEMDKELDAL